MKIMAFGHDCMWCGRLLPIFGGMCFLCYMVEEYLHLWTGKYVVSLWNGGGMLLQDNGRFIPDYTVSYA